MLSFADSLCSTPVPRRVVSRVGLAFRNLVEYGAWGEAEVKAMAEEIEIIDGPNDEGEMFERPGKLSDYMPGPYANDEAARASASRARLLNFFPPPPTKTRDHQKKQSERVSLVSLSLKLSYAFRRRTTARCRRTCR